MCTASTAEQKNELINLYATAHTHQYTHTDTPTSISPHKALRELNEPAFNNLSAAVKIKTPYGEPKPKLRRRTRARSRTSTSHSANASAVAGSWRSEPRRVNTRGSRSSAQDITQSQVSCRRHGFGIQKKGKK